MPTHEEPVADLLRYFKYEHLSEPLRSASQPFARLAEWLANALPDGTQKEMALWRLLEAKDCAVRSALDLRKRD